MWFLRGGSTTVAFHPDLRMVREFEADHYLVEIDQGFVDILNEYFNTRELSEVMLK